MDELGTLANHYDEMPRDRRRRLTAGLLQEAREATEPERREILEQVVLVNICVARSIASRYRSRGISTEDLEQVASLALVRAVQNFDASREGDLLSYAVPSIRGEVRRYFRDKGWTVRPPRRIQELQTQVIEARERLGCPSAEEIAADLEVPVADVDEALAAQGCFTPASLDAAVAGDGSMTRGQLLADPSGPAAAVEARVMLEPVVRSLPDHDRKLLRLRFFDELTQQEIAAEVGVTQSQVSRSLSRILGDLRRGLGEVTGADAVEAPAPPRPSPSRNVHVPSPRRGEGPPRSN